MQSSNSRAPRVRFAPRSFTGRRLAPMIETMEDRQLMTGGVGAGFLTGSVLTDGSSGAPVSGVTVELFKASNTGTPVSVQTTGANGQYLFTGLQPGDYLLKDLAPKGYTASGASAVSQLDPASVVGNDTIKVTVVDPSKVFVNYNGIVPTSYSVVNDKVKGVSKVNSVGPQSDTLGTSAGATDLNAGFQTFCVNDQESLSFGGGEHYQVTPEPVTALTNGSGTISADAAGRIAYLFNHFGNSSLTNIQGAGLQLAIWELLYDGGSTPDFSAGAFQVTGQYASVNGETLSQVISQAQSYYNQSAGKSETAVVLDASTYSCTGQGVQSVLATEALNFTVHQNSPCGPVCPPPVCPPPVPVCPPPSGSGCDHDGGHDGGSGCDQGGDNHGGSGCDQGGDNHGGQDCQIFDKVLSDFCHDYTPSGCGTSWGFGGSSQKDFGSSCHS